MSGTKIEVLGYWGIKENEIAFDHRGEAARSQCLEGQILAARRQSGVRSSTRSRPRSFVRWSARSAFHSNSVSATLAFVLHEPMLTVARLLPAITAACSANADLIRSAIVIAQSPRAVEDTQILTARRPTSSQERMAAFAVRARSCTT